MQKETWKPVVSRGVSFVGYEVSDLGNIRSSSGMLKPFSDGVRYMRVDLMRDGKKHPRRVHNLVLEAFAGPSPKGMEACHGNLGCLVNSLDNLCWGARAKNMGEDKVRDGTSNRGERCGANKLTENQVVEIRSMLRNGVPQREIATIYGVIQQTISSIKSGKIWGWLAAG